MDFRKIVQIPLAKNKIHHQEDILLMGSCFAENIGKRLVEGRFSTLTNPFGILYNPSSISAALRQIISQEYKIKHEDLFCGSDGVWHSFDFHSNYSGITAELALERMNSSIEDARGSLLKAKHLIVTFGTSWVFRLSDGDNKGSVVGNCHKLPAKMFTRERLRVDDIVRDWRDLLIDIQKFRQGEPLRVVFTVSPIRHWKDGAFENQCSKATLILAIDELIKGSVNMEYFPTYEIFMDELRDYRFYDSDMIHPSEVGVDYVWERFADTYFSAQTQRELQEWDKIRRMLDHRPSNGMDERHLSFLKGCLLKMEAFSLKHPHFDLCLEIEELRDICNTY
ncbi:MAG: GSCFA domain-containing protein [Bacteroidales bacterium]